MPPTPNTSHDTCNVLLPEDWARQNGYAYFKHTFPDFDLNDVYVDENTPKQFLAGAIEYAKTPPASLTIEAEDAMIGCFGFAMPNGAVDEAFFVFSKNHDLLTEDPYWIPWYDRYGPFDGFDADASTLRVDFATANHYTIDKPIFHMGSRSNWGHWVVDFLPLLHHWENHPDKDQLHITCGPLTRTQKQTLLVMGVPLDKIIELPITTDGFSVIHAPKIVVPSLLPKHVRSAFIRDHFGVWQPEEKVSTDKVYFSRRRFAPRHRINNDAEISQFAAGYNFQTIDIETLDFSAQIDVLRQTKIAMFPFGAGGTNTTICGPDTVAICLFPPNLIKNRPKELFQRETVSYLISLGIPLILVHGTPIDTHDSSVDALMNVTTHDVKIAIDRAQHLSETWAGKQPADLLNASTVYIQA